MGKIVKYRETDKVPKGAVYLYTYKDERIVSLVAAEITLWFYFLVPDKGSKNG